MSRWIAFGVLAGSVLWSCLGLIQYGELLAAWWGKSVSERGALGSDERRSFLTRAGRTRLRERLAEEAGNAGSLDSAAAEAWRWCFERSAGLPRDSRIRLNVPSIALYYFGSFFFHPARLEVNPGGSPITDARSLRVGLRQVKQGEFERLAAQGYSHVIVGRGRGFGMVELRPPAQGGGP